MKKNKLEIIENPGLEVADTIYIVKDAYNTYLRTRYKSVAETAFQQLKNEYKRNQNAS